MVDFIIASGARSLGNHRRCTLIYLIATKAKSPDAFYSTLSASGLSDSAAAQSFASEVYNRAPRKHKTKKPEDVARKLAEKEAKLLQKQQFAYLLDDDGAQGSGSDVKADKGKSKEKEKRHGKHRIPDMEGRQALAQPPLPARRRALL